MENDLSKIEKLFINDIAILKSKLDTYQNDISYLYRMVSRLENSIKCLEKYKHNIDHDEQLEWACSKL